MVRILERMTDVDPGRRRSYRSLDGDRLDAVLEISRLGQWELDTDSFEIRASALYYELLGYPQQPQTWYWADFLRHVVDTDREMVATALRVSLESQSSCAFECRIVSAGALEKWVRVGARFLLNPDSRPLLLGVLSDISELKENEFRFRGTLDCMMEGCQIIGRDLRYLYVNPVAAYHGRRKISELLGFSMLECYPGIEDTELFAALKRAMSGGPPEQMENVFAYADGTDATFLLHIQPVTEGVFILSLDISQRKAMENELRSLNEQLEHRVIERTSQLEEANKELEAFSYSVSHDLRSPLRALDAYSQLLAKKYAENLPAEAAKYLNSIRKSTQRMGHLVDDLLRFSQVGRHPFVLSSVDTAALVREALEDLAAQPEYASACVEVGDLPPCRGDERLLLQVWSNLLSNALKYSRKRPKPLIRVGVCLDSKTTYFVSDNGAGFDMTYAGQLFGVFQRLHRAEDFEGTGVGLAIVERIIHRHGGTIWAEASPDEGATFFFRLEAAP